MGLPIRIETRTGDTSPSKRQRQRRDPPDILLTTPEQLALLLASADARLLFADLKRVVIDELHALVGLEARRSAGARSRPAARDRAADAHASACRRRSRDPDELRRWLVRKATRRAHRAISSPRHAGAAPDISMLDTQRASALGRPYGAPCARAKSTSCIKSSAYDARLRQYPRAGRIRLSRSCGG